MVAALTLLMELQNISWQYYKRPFKPSTYHLPDFQAIQRCPILLTDITTKYKQFLSSWNFPFCAFYHKLCLFIHQQNAHTIRYMYYHLLSYKFWHLLHHLQGELRVCSKLLLHSVITQVLYTYFKKPHLFQCGTSDKYVFLNCIKPMYSQNITRISSIPKKVLPEYVAIRAKTCRRRGDNWYMYFTVYVHFVGVLKDIS